MTYNNSNAKFTAGFCTLGCRVNQYETRAVEEAFEALGFEIRRFEEKCDVYVINTCTVTAESDRKSRQMIRRAVKNGGKLAAVIVIGCMAQTSADSVIKIDGVDAVFGNNDKLGCAAKALELVKAKQAGVKSSGALNLVQNIFDFTQIEKMSVHGSDNTRAFLKVVDGCDNRCSYCVIPKARGHVRSKSLDDISAECRDIAASGCREIVLTGIETAAFGKDCGLTLADLAQCAAKTPELKRIRFGSLEPTVITETLTKRLSEIPQVMPHFHLSLQSGCDEVLAGMRRKYNTKMFSEKLDILSKYFDKLEITTDIIVGFPGETEEMFRKTMDYVEKCGFLYVHVFPYSDRAGTEASGFDGKLSEKEKHRRARLLTEKMLDVRRGVLKKYLDKPVKVLCETKKNGVMHGYTENYIEIHIPDCAGLSPNDEICALPFEISPDAQFMSAKRL